MRAWKNAVFVAALALFAAGLCGCGAMVSPLPADQIPGSSGTDQWATANGVRYHYQEWKNPGPNVVLIHGFASSSWTWKDVAPALADRGYHVWAVDLKGFGYSDKPRDADYSPPALMEGVNAWMDAVGIQKATVAGNSLGGFISIQLALTHPDKVERLVLVDSAGYEHEMPAMVSMTRMPMAEGMANLFWGEWMVRMSLKDVFYNKKLVTEDRVQAYYDRLRTENGMHALIRTGRQTKGAFSPWVPRIPQIRQPTLIIWGENDPWTPVKLGRRFRQDIADSVLAILPRCGHMPQEEKPEVTVRLMDDFLRGRPILDSGA
ncbi:MAG: alpha/beta hydrolase [Proteobacteria bacterium]|nr:alpha/beta hydrolase [Pseudomonadota bacterium]